MKYSIALISLFILLLVILHPTTGSAQWVQKWSTTHLSLHHPNISSIDNIDVGILQGNFKGNGILDVVVYGTGRVMILNGITGSVEFQVASDDLQSGYFFQHPPLIADIDNDDLDELVISGGSGARITVAYEYSGGIGQLPDYPDLHLPANGGLGVSNPASLHWHPAARAEKYWYQIALTPDVNNPLLTATTTDTFTVASLSSNTTYYWRVWSENSVGLSEFSSPWWSFTTGTTTDVADMNPVPPAFALEQNYPNPFNPETTIKYAVNEPGPVTLLVYNGLGAKVRTLLDLPLVEPGTYSIIWNGKGDNGQPLATGIYYYHIRSGEFVLTKSAIMLK